MRLILLCSSFVTCEPDAPLIHLGVYWDSKWATCHPKCDTVVDRVGLSRTTMGCESYRLRWLYVCHYVRWFFSLLSSSPLNSSTIVSRTVIGDPCVLLPSQGFHGRLPSGPHFLWFTFLYILNSASTIADFDLARRSHPHRASHTHDQRCWKHPPCRYLHMTTSERQK